MGDIRALKSLITLYNKILYQFSVTVAFGDPREVEADQVTGSVPGSVSYNIFAASLAKMQNVM